jgi:hypothetical protein
MYQPPPPMADKAAKIRHTTTKRIEGEKEAIGLVDLGAVDFIVALCSESVFFSG